MAPAELIAIFRRLPLTTHGQANKAPPFVSDSARVDPEQRQEQASQNIAINSPGKHGLVVSAAPQKRDEPCETPNLDLSRNEPYQRQTTSFYFPRFHKDLSSTENVYKLVMLPLCAVKRKHNIRNSPSQIVQYPILESAIT